MFASTLSRLIPNMQSCSYKLFSSTAMHFQMFGSTKILKVSDGLHFASKLSTKTKGPSKMCTKKNNAKKCSNAKLKKTMGGGDIKICACTGGETSKPKQPKNSYIVDKCDVTDIPKANSKLYRNISLCCLPLIAAFAGYVLTRHEAKELHFVPYEYMYKRTKRFPWGDGRTTLFHGPNNLIPEEQQYEKIPNHWDNDLELRKALRNQHAKEELERRHLRHDRESRGDEKYNYK